MKIPLVLLVILIGLVHSVAQKGVIFIIFDDLGHGDIGIHSPGASATAALQSNTSRFVHTPNIDGLFHDAIQLDRFYGTPQCSPSRSALNSARTNYHTGIFNAFDAGNRQYLNTSYSISANMFKAANFDTYQLGKWHLACGNASTWPRQRGFDYTFGFISGAQSYTEHTESGYFDYYENNEPYLQASGVWSNDLIVQKAISIIKKYGPNASDVHDELLARGDKLAEVGNQGENPFFLYVAFQAIHVPLTSPEEYEKKYENATTDKTRNKVLSMVHYLDHGVGALLDALKEQQLYDDVTIFAMSDNGGPTHTFDGSFSSNYPLRGGKDTLFEGGCRLNACIKPPTTSPDENSKSLALPHANTGKNQIYKGYMHVTDVLPTVFASIGLNMSDLVPKDEPPYGMGDGVNIWLSIQADDPSSSARSVVFLSAHPPDTPISDADQGWAVIHDGWKYIEFIPVKKTGKKENGWWNPPDQPTPVPSDYTVDCRAPLQSGHFSLYNSSGSCEKGCLFNIEDDPCEFVDLKDSHPERLAGLKALLREASANAVPNFPEIGCPRQHGEYNGTKIWTVCTN